MFTSATSFLLTLGFSVTAIASPAPISQLLNTNLTHPHGIDQQNFSYASSTCSSRPGWQPPLLPRAGQVSTDATCGGKAENICTGSIYGNCCSTWGYCGSTLEYCGNGCQPRWGFCSGFPNTPVSPPAPAPAPAQSAPVPPAPAPEAAGPTPCYCLKRGFWCGDRTVDGALSGGCDAGTLFMCTGERTPYLSSLCAQYGKRCVHMTSKNEGLDACNK